MASNDSPFFLLYFGVTHSGKSTDLEKFMKRCGKPSVFVYNRGYDKDWAGFEEIELIADKKSKTLYFLYKGKEYDFNKHFFKKFHRKKVKCIEAEDELAEELLFNSLARKDPNNDKYKKQLFFIIEDATTIFNSSLKRLHRRLFYRLKHAGVWTCLVCHDPAIFPIRAYGPVTMVRFFKMSIEPDIKKAKVIPHFRQFLAAYKFLSKAPRFSSCTLDMTTGKLTKKTFKKPIKK